jgi:hypothetical protein
MKAVRQLDARPLGVAVEPEGKVHSIILARELTPKVTPGNYHSFLALQQ